MTRSQETRYFENKNEDVKMEISNGGLWKMSMLVVLVMIVIPFGEDGHVRSYDLTCKLASLTALHRLFTTALRSCYTSSGDEVFSGAVFGVNSKFSGKDRSLSLLKAHDNLRHLQILAAGVDLPLGGTGRPDAVG
uniref:Aspartic proteinase-like protein 2 isoform X1 n=1 Tax=Tanacetum cinerariifolium TaxID=118510 RepID=A0A6L2N2Q1_TANCI|nr:aspartic proteinase-like protein 2 isoform X1 [Tanacetum cinerariifolium]